MREKGVKRVVRGEMVRSEAEQARRGFGVQGKGAASPFIPCFLDVEEIHSLFSSDGGLRFLRMNPRMSSGGWTWFDRGGKLLVMSTPNQDNPMSQDFYPIMGNDVWEHAYYLKYQNRRGDYLKEWWNVVNWTEVNKRFQDSQK